ncbi:hypothetical protein SALBM217S_02251 [Streptomyces griseoloalbus]
MVLAVIGTVLALTLGGDDEDGKGDPGPRRRPERGGERAQRRNQEEDEGGAQTDGSATASSDSGTGAGEVASGTARPARVATSPAARRTPTTAARARRRRTRRAKGSRGTNRLPKGWKYQSSDEAGDRFTGPDGQKLLVGWTTTPKDDPVADWKAQEGYMVRPQYKRIRIVKVEYRGWKTADWEFTYVDGGVKYRSVDRGTVVNDGLGYGLMYTAKADAWDGEQRRNTWRTLTQTFTPKS